MDVEPEAACADRRQRRRGQLAVGRGRLAVGFVLLPLVGLAWLVFTIIGAVKASSGQDYRYPFALRLVS